MSETTTDALKWFESLIKYYKQEYDPQKALDGILSEVQSCIVIAEYPKNDGTRFKEATERFNRLLQ